MQTQTFIKDTATVARVTQLEEGDAYRRLIPKETYDSAKVALGVVTGVLNNGETVAITAIEISAGRFGGEPEVKERVFEADSDLALFPANDEETELILADARRSGERTIATAEKNLRDAKDKVEKVESISERIYEAQHRQAQQVTGNGSAQLDQA